MKKVISVIMALVMILSISVVAFAEDQTYTVYDDYGNAYTLREGEILGVVTDANGNIVSTHLMRTQYVNGTEYTIPAMGKFTSYQYKPSNEFGIGFYFNYNNQYFTDAGKNLRITIQMAETVGASTRYGTKSEFFTTNKSDNIGGTYYEVTNGWPCIRLTTDRLSPTFIYYNGVIENISSTPTTVSVIVTMD